MKYILIKIEVCSDGSEYYQYIIRCVVDDIDIEEYANEYISDFFGKNCGYENGVYKFDGGAVTASVNKVSVLTNREYITLNKYL